MILLLPQAGPRLIVFPFPGGFQAVVTVFIPSRQWRFQVKIRPTDYLRDIIEVVVARATDAFGEVIAGFSGDGVWLIGDVESTKDTTGSPSGSVAAGGTTSSLVTLSTSEPIFSQCPGKRCVCI